MPELKIGEFVRTSEPLGTGKIIAKEGNQVIVEYFVSIKTRIRKTVPLKDIESVFLDFQTRCYFWDEIREHWSMGRITGRISQEYQVDFPDDFSQYVGTENLYVRCSEPVEDPIEILINQSHETAFFNRERTSFVRTVMKQREVARGMEGLLSSSVKLFPHQIEVIRRVSEDPIPRYLLADEVGLGKTIEAGIIVRQYLLDNPSARVLIIVPLFLKKQWQTDLLYKCNLYSVSNQITWFTTDRLPFGGDLIGSEWDMIVIDEAHEIASKAFKEETSEVDQYKMIEQLTSSSKGLLLLSATPVLHNQKDFLAMLHLLDPDNYHLDDLERFKMLVDIRQEIGRSLFTLRENAKPLLLRKAVERIGLLIPDDIILKEAIEELMSSLDGEDFNRRSYAVRLIRTHLTETYRLHRRLLRNRRDALLDLLKGGRDSENEELQIYEEYDFDERTASLQDLLDEWRQAAWAQEREDWEGKGFTYTSPYQKLFLCLLELSSSALPVFNDVLLARLEGKETLELGGNYSDEDLNLILRTPIFEGERELLESIIKSTSQPSDEGDRLEHLRMVVENVLRQATTKKRPIPKIVIFTGFKAASSLILADLTLMLGEKGVARYTSELSDNEVEKEMERFHKDSECIVLVCDPSGEVGRNLQFADVLIHFDLLIKPNRMEQRIGRLDRIGRVDIFSSYIFTGPDHPSLIDAWYVFLNEGLRVFHSSISSLQFLVDQILPEIYGRLYVEGSEALIGYVRKSLAERIQEEQLKVAEQNALDEIDAGESKVHHYFNDLVAYDLNYEEIKNSMEGWIITALQFEKRHSNKDREMFKYHPTRRTLIPISLSIEMAKRADEVGSYDRELAISNQSCRLYRVGDPFVQMVDDYTKWDDRGRSFAFWRKVKGWKSIEGHEWFGFVFHYVIEGDISEAKTFYENSLSKQINSKALQRKMDRYLTPSTYTLYLNSFGELETDGEVIQALQQPFTRLSDYGNDTNLTKDRLAIIDSFISKDNWMKTCLEMRRRSEEHLINDQSYQVKLDEMARIALQEFRIQEQQLFLRAKRQHSITAQVDTGNVDFEKGFNEAIIRGIKKPRIRLDSVGFIILSGRELVEDQDE